MAEKQMKLNSSVNKEDKIPHRFDQANVDTTAPILLSLCTLSSMLGQPLTLDVLTSSLPTDRRAPSIAACLRAAEQQGLSARSFHRPQLKALSRLTLPCLLLLHDNNSCILTDLNGDEATIIPAELDGQRRTLSLKELQQDYSGYCIFAHVRCKMDKRVGDKEQVSTRQWFWGTILRFWPIYKHVLLATAVINILGIAGPLFIMNVYDRVVPNNALETLWVLALGVMIAYIFDFILRNLRGYFVDIAGKNADVLIASQLMQQLTAIRMDHKPDSTGTLANNLREFEALREFFSSTTLLALIDIPFIAIFIALIGYIGGPLAWAPALAVPVVILIGLLIQVPFRQMIDQGYRESSQKSALLVEAIFGLETIKTSLARGQIQQRWEKVVGANARTSARVKSLANFSLSFSIFATHVVSVLIIIGGVYLIGEGRMTLGGLIACNILVGRALSPLAAVAAMFTRLQQARSALGALDMLMKIPNESPEDQQFMRQPHLSNSLAFEEIRFAYPQAQTMALRDLTLKIRPGERVGIIGRTGCGKSTLGRLALGLYTPEQGQISVGGIDIRQLHVADLRSRIGYVSQDNYLFYGSIRDNITFGAPEADDQAILHAARISGVSDFIHQHPAGFDCPVGERGSALSGGQRQAITIARALLTNPDILIFDEPTSAMDNGSEQRFCQRLKPELSGKTLLLFTHRFGLLTMVDRLIVMDGGRIVADGPKRHVLEALKKQQIHATSV
ncbi:type I secretion system permease/ATPase [Desulfuromonas acetoxidans]|uniref:type I secretion system permease/ATPase n=1 Tax=Desulfuromonas acetoxidans TaxID=891 RepID=UPI00292D5C61|nr:type I secretion system permease/ATPase [Desulfuromonas acetoxidans]